MSDITTHTDPDETIFDSKSLVSRLQNRLFDVVVIGGGIAGLSCAKEVATKGFDTLLLEKSLLGSGTSNNSLRIIHGGLRYLSRLNFPQMIESLKDQEHILRDAPSLVKSLPCIIPLEKYGFHSKPLTTIASFIYNHTAEFITGNARISQIVDCEFVSRYAPSISEISPLGGLLWYDARIRDPQKLHALMAHKLDREGGDSITSARVIKVVKEGSLFRVIFIIDNNEYEVVSRVVINASGFQLFDIPVHGMSFQRKPITWAKAFNVILNEKLEDRFAVGFKTSTRRQYFVVPRGNNSVIGTGYLPFIPNENSLSVSPKDISNFLSEPSKVFKKVLTSSSADVGVIPVKSISKDGSKISFLGRSQVIDYGGYIEIVTTKYSGFRSLGIRTLNCCRKYLK